MRPSRRLCADASARPGITEDVLTAIGNKSKLLNKSRKKRRAPESLAEKEVLAGWKVHVAADALAVYRAVCRAQRRSLSASCVQVTASHSPHLASTPGITCLDMHGQSSLVRGWGVTAGTRTLVARCCRS